MILPIYFRIFPFWIWLALWSGPYEPANLWDRIKAMRITIRYGENHSKIIFVIKKGKE